MKRRPPLRIWLAVFLALQVADAITTYVGLHMGAREGAPLYGFLFGHTSFAVATVVKALAAGIICVWVWLNALVRPRLALWQAMSACGFMLLVVGDNMLVIATLAA
jgi:hypothetical protein